jgi:hypothetical protein
MLSKSLKKHERNDFMTNDPCVDLTDLYEITDGDIELKKELFDEFILSSNHLINALELDCLENSNHQRWGETAHALKGIAVNLGALQLGDLAKQAQDNRDKNIALKKVILLKIQAEHQKVLDFLINNTQSRIQKNTTTSI